MSLDASRIGRRIRLLRLNKGWTQKELARASGVSLNQVVGWEKGRYTAALKRRAVVAKALGVQPEMLFFSREERAILLDDAATDVMLSVARQQDASPAQRLNAARGLKSKTPLEKTEEETASDFRRLMQATEAGLGVLIAGFDALEE
ncbi:MAG: helix-turn-helix transcriptional regulator [Rhizomicrobium sp.]|jgi:transcriptional regulator with XRE-family HTH domain